MELNGNNFKLKKEKSNSRGKSIISQVTDEL